MRKYWQFIKMSFQELAEFRMNLLWEIGGISIYNIFIYLFWVTALSSGISDSGYTTQSLGIYYLLIILVGQFTYFNFWDIANSIRDDYISVDIAKPYNFTLKSFCITVAPKIVKVVITLSVLIYILHISGFQTTLTKTFLFILGLLLASIARFFIGMSIGLLAFWFKRVHGFNALFWHVGGLFSGELIPIDLLPIFILNISIWLPFQYLTYFPVSLIIKNIEPYQIFIGFFIQTFWIICFGMIYRFLWTKGIRKLESAGG